MRMSNNIHSLQRRSNRELLRLQVAQSQATVKDIDGLVALVADCVDDEQLVDVVALALSRLENGRAG